jgi:hypothetical protein
MQAGTGGIILTQETGREWAEKFGRYYALHVAAHRIIDWQSILDLFSIIAAQITSVSS